MLEKRDIEILIQISERCKRINNIIFNIKYDEFINSVDKVELTCFNLLQIGELVHCLSDKYKNTHKSITWTKITGMRNKIVHGYGSVNYEIVWYTALNDIPILLKHCMNTINKWCTNN